MEEPVAILVIEDDRFVARTIERCLRSNHFAVTVANNGADGLEQARLSPPDLVILDIMMQGMDGYAVCMAMRADRSLAHVPVLFLTAKVKTEDKITGFRAGADDYLCKPFNLDELMMRLQAILKRTLSPERMTTLLPVFAASDPSIELDPNQPRPHHLVAGEYSLDTHTFELQTPTQGKVRLTPLQYDLLYHLMTHPDEVFSPSRLLAEVWDHPEGRGSADLVRVHIKTLRERIEIDPRAPGFLRTVPGRGYTVGRSQPTQEEN